MGHVAREMCNINPLCLGQAPVEMREEAMADIDPVKDLLQ